eukprot:TRINITY_DN96108_c0_g1_i1.p1 TRINITY_DN96108_c0_g1~~TRINITY_DN96108_c0_g1_i1.p1  ORF type:complete len:313 (-),score=70.70 TRINITY_DN96108_c0_g1_i1:27-905(-)
MASEKPLLQQGKRLGTNKDIDVAKSQLEEVFGRKEDDDLAENPKLDDWMDGVNEMSFYEFIALVREDTIHNFVNLRQYAKAIFLPMMQVLIPYFVISHQYKVFHWEEGGICPDSNQCYFRVVGFIMFIYSLWQISDSVHEGASEFLMRQAAKRYAITGVDFMAHFSMGVGYMLQVICGLLLLISLYLLFSSSKDPMDLIMNCVALNFLLAIDSEWMSDTCKKLGADSAKVVFKRWRDTIADNEEFVKERLENAYFRRHAEAFVTVVFVGGKCMILITGYVLAVFFLFCDPAW